MTTHRNFALQDIVSTTATHRGVSYRSDGLNCIYAGAPVRLDDIDFALPKAVIIDILDERLIAAENSKVEAN